MTTMKRILVIGGGGIGQRHIQLLLAAGSCSVSCLEIQPGRLAECRLRFPRVQLYSEMPDATSDDFEGAIIATPAHTHIALALWCVERRINFLIEKPLAVKDEGIEQLITKTNAAGVIAGVAYPRRYSVGVKALRRRIAIGSIGDLKMLHATYSQDFRLYRPDYAATYYAKAATGGGIILDALSHHLDMATHIAGEVSEVGCFADRMVFEGCEGEDAALISLRFRNGILGSVQGNQFQKPNVDAIELVGTLANMRYERVSGILAMKSSDKGGWESEPLDGDWNRIMMAQTEAFLAAIDGGAPFLTSLEDAWHTLKIALAAHNSRRTGCIVRIGEVPR
jgi:predicted dehydrogenase